MIIPRTESTASRRSVNLTLLQLIMTFMMIMAIFNLAVVHKVSTITNNRSNIPARLRGEIWQRGLREEESTIAHPRALLGIFSRDDDKGYKQRQHYRTIFETVWNDDPRVCSLPRFWEKVNGPNKPLHQNDCLLVYTFVIGAHSRNDTTKPTEIVEDFRTLYDEPEQKELFVVDKISNPYSEDVNRSDVTRLNIRENDHNGKSQTFLNYAYRHVFGSFSDHENPWIEYCIKISPDTFLSLDKYFAFARTELAPAPFHRGVLGGVLRDKSYGMSSSQDGKELVTYTSNELPRLESFWGNEFEGIHLYMSGQRYILSCDLVEFVLKEVPYSRLRVAPGGYVLQQEGHDIFSMAFHSPTPIHVITIGKSQRFWTFPVKRDDHWKRLLSQEVKPSTTP